MPHPLAPRLLAAALLASGVVSAVMGAPGRAEADASGASVDIVKVQGVIDPALSGYVRGVVEQAERAGSTVILQIDSGGSYGDQAVRLGRFIRGASIPVVGWVGPSGATVQGGALFLLYSTSLATMAPGAGIGPARPFDLATRASRERPSEASTAGRSLEALAPGAGAAPEGVARLVEGAEMAAAPARTAGAVSLVAQDIPTLLRDLDGRTVTTSHGPRTLATLSRSGRPVEVRFHEIGPVRRTLHAVSTPVAVYVLLVLGIWGVAFEFTQPGLGLAGIGGGVFLAFAGYGLTVIPVHWIGIVLLVAGTALQGLDVIIRRLGALTIGGTALFAAGSGWAWWGVAPNVDLPAWLIGLFTVSGMLLLGFGFTVALKARERVRTAQIGLVGLVGEVRTDLNPEGGVYVKGTLWRGRSNNGRIPKGTRVRVRGIDGLVLRVEPDPEE